MAIFSIEVQSISPSLPLLPEPMVKIWPLRSLQAPTSDALHGTVPEGVPPRPPRPRSPLPPFCRVQRGRHHLLEPSQVESLRFSFPGISLDPLFCSSCRTNSHKHDSFIKVLEECNPVVLVLVLMLVLVGRPSALARGSKKSVLLAFLLSICLLRNYEHSIILEWATQGNDDVTRSLAQRSRFHFNRSTWVHMHKKTPGNKTSIS